MTGNYFPIVKVERECPIHGKYESYELCDKNFETPAVCPKCREEALAESEKKARANNFEDFLKDNLRDLGVGENDLNGNFDNFKTSTPQLGKMKEAAMALLENPKILIVVILGKSGIGKTHLAAACLKTELKYGRSIDELGYTTHTRLIRQFKAAQNFKAKRDVNELHEMCVSIPFWVIDEVGRATAGEFETIEFFDLLSDRINKEKKTLVLSNMTATQFKESFEDHLLSRIAGYGLVVEVNDTEDYRRKIRER